MIQYSKVGISFAGGGLKSFSHVAATTDFEAHGIEPVAISGTSMGSVIGALYACGIRGKQLEEYLLNAEALFKEKRILQKPTYRILPFVKERSDGFIESIEFMELAQELIDNLEINMLSEVPLPLCIVAVDLNSGHLIFFSNKPEYFRTIGNNSRFYDKDIELSKAITASCAFPLVFESVVVDDLRLTDGGVLLNSPGAVFNPNKVEKIVSLTTMNTDQYEVGHSLQDVAYRSIMIMMHQLELMSLEGVDLNVNFSIPTKYIFEVGKGKEIIDKAYDYIKEHPIDYTKLEQPKTLKNLWGLL